MRVIITECEVLYIGRGETFLPKGTRAIIIKNDGAVSIHSDEGNKPLNYMPAGSQLEITKHSRKQKWVFTNKKETIEILVYKIFDDHTYNLPPSDNTLQRYKTEKQLQSELKSNPNPILQHYGYTLETNHSIETHVEYNTKAGTIDLLINNHTLQLTHIVELKRTAMLGAVDQCVRYRQAYIDTISENVQHYKLTVAIAAYIIKPNTQTQANKNNVDCIRLEH
jgi:endonuclease